jgi:DNA ligase-1
VKTFPTLYKKTSTGAVQYWTICVIKKNLEDSVLGLAEPFGLIRIEYGQLGTDSPQQTSDIVSAGKNHGKKNATTAFEQAQAEAEAKWKKQLKKGYVGSVIDAEDSKLDDIIEGGILPMLAHTFEKQGHKIKYPCYFQPKLDGLRMIAILKDGKCTLWSRTRKPINSLPHIIADIEKNFKEDIVLDGEAYNHKFKTNFEHIVHLVRQDDPDPEHTDVEYHVYDVASPERFERRLEALFDVFQDGSKLKYLKMVPTHVVQDENQVSDFYTKSMSEGYEGIMLRNAAGAYVNKRSSDLIKVKEMKDDEFEIIGISEGRGKLTGHVGAFVCVTDDGTEFLAKMSGETKRLRDYFEDHSLWEGKKLTVQFQDLTSYGIPRFPVGLRIRELE